MSEPDHSLSVRPNTLMHRKASPVTVVLTEAAEPTERVLTRGLISSPVRHRTAG